MRILLSASTKELLRDRQSLFWALVFPIMILVVFSLFSLDRSSRTELLVAGASNAAEFELVDALNELEALEVDTRPTLSEAVALELLDDDEADVAVAPIEYSLEGAVTYTLDVLIHGSMLSIRDEIVLPIHHCLLAMKGTETQGIETVYSHPQSLGQCREYLERKFPNVQQVASLSNSAAVACASVRPGTDRIKSRIQAL